MRASLALVVGASITLGCSSNSSATGPDPRNCTKGSVSFPATITAKMDASACHIYDYFYLGDSSNYWAYDVRLDSGSAYTIDLAATDSTRFWEGMLELVGRDPSTGDEQLLTISDGEGVRYGAQLYFVAPQSGTFSLRAINWNFGDTATFKLETRRCPSSLPQIRDSLIDSTQTIASNDCWLQRPQFAADSVQVKLYTIWMAPGHQKTITVSSGVMNPGFQVFGPGFGLSCDYGFTGCGGGVAYSNDYDVVSGKPGGPALGSLGSTKSLTIDAFGGYNCYYICVPVDYAGQYTLAIGPGLSSEGTSFTLTVQDIPQSAGSRVSNSPIPGLYDLHLDHLVKRPRHSPASLARKWVATTF